MKNLLIYTTPQKKFSSEDEILARVQIDNCLELGWKNDDILLVTDFPYEYNGIKALQIPTGLYYDFDLNASKSRVLSYLLNHDFLVKDSLYWCHDLDAYENNQINEEDLELTNYDLGLTHYFYKPEWQFGSLFLKPSAKDILNLLDQEIMTRPHNSRNNEKKLTWLIKHNKIDPNRYKKLNPTYNFTKRYMNKVFAEAEKPLKVLHFRPSDKDALMKHSALQMFMYGNNELNMPLVSDRLVRIFKYHGIS